MSQPTQTREVALDHRTQAQAFTDAAALVAGQLWDEVNPDRVVDSWAEQVPELNAVVSGAQLGTARLADSYVTDALEVQDLSGESVAPINPAGFSGTASDGRGLLSLLASPAFITVATIADGVDILRAMQFGRASLDTIVRTQLADAGRLADQTSLTAHPSARGYIRQTDGNPCKRCLVLAGRFYQFNQGFQRHPRCGCTHVPAGPSMRPLDPRALYDRMTPVQRVRAGFTHAEMRALDEGADIFQVVNAQRGVYTAGGRQFTREGTTRRGLARQRLGRGTPRLTPDQIFASAGTREEALRLLYRNGYLLQPDPRMFATLRGLPEPDLSRLTVADLKALAKDRGVVGYSKMRKPELLDALGSPAPVKAAAKAAAKKAPAKKAATAPAVPVRSGPDALRSGQMDFSDVPSASRAQGATTAEINAVQMYANDAQRINALIRQGRTGSRAITGLDSLMRRSRLTSDVELWRGLRTGDMFPSLADDLTGFEWAEQAYLSTTASRRVAEQFAGTFRDAQPVLLRVRAPAGTPAITVSSWGESALPILAGRGQAEVLLGRGARLRVVADNGWQVIDGVPVRVRVLDVEVIPAAPTKAAKATKAAPVKKAAKVAAPRKAATPDLTGARGLSSDPAVRAVQVDNRIQQAYQDVREVRPGAPRDRPTRPDSSGQRWVSLADVREHPLVRDLDRDEVDRALVGFIRNGPRRDRQGIFIEAEMNQSALTLRERTAAVRIGGENNHFLRIDRPGLTPLPAAPAKAAKKATKAAPVKKAAKAPAVVGDDVLAQVPVRFTGVRPNTTVVGGRMSASQREELAETLRSYVSGSFQPVGRVRRGLATPDTETGQFVDRLTAAFDDAMRTSRLGENVVVWRGLRSGRGVFGARRLDDDLAGFEWVDESFVSTAATRAVADRFGRLPGGDQSVMLRIQAPRGTGALVLEAESELLLERGLRFRVVADRGMVDGSRLLDVEVIPAAAKAAKAAKKAGPVKKVTGPPAPSRMTGPALRAELERAGVTVPARLSKATLADEVTALRGGAPAREISERLSPPPAVPGSVGPQAARLPKVADPQDVRAQARATNPRNGKAYEGPVTPEVQAAGVSYSVNCTRVVIAHEMRRRGLDVTAGATTLAGDIVSVYVRAFRLNGRYATRVADDLSRSMSARQVADEAASWPRGARGIVTMDGHTLMVERDRLTGKVMFIDAQNPTRSGPMSLAEFERRARARGASTTQRMAVARVDDLDMSDYALRYVESPALDIADGQVGKTAFPQDPGSETFTQFDEMARLTPDDVYPGPRAAVRDTTRARPVQVETLMEADDAAIEAALRDVYEGQFGPYTTKVKVQVRRAGSWTDSRGRTHKIHPSVGVEGEILDATGRKIGYFGRTISEVDLHYADGVVRREIWADHAIVQLEPRFQGKGFGAAFNQRAIEWYRASGVHGISLSDHNGYVWASQGFGFAQGKVPEHTVTALRSLIDDLRAGRTKDQFGVAIPRALREASDLDAQLVLAEDVLRRAETLQPGATGYPTARELSQIGRTTQRGKSSTWLGKHFMFNNGSTSEMVLNPGQGVVIS